MKHLLKISMVIAIVAIAMTGCKKDDDKKDNNGGNMQTVALKGIVKDTGGTPLGGVKVITGTASATTDGKGEFTFDKVSVVNKRAVMKFEKSGYFTLTRSGVKEGEMFIEAVLTPKGNGDFTLQTKFDASAEKTLNVKGMKVALSPSAVMRADGSTYNGNVNADMLYLDPNNENFDAMMPGGDLAGIRTDGSESVLVSYGMSDVQFTDDQGNPLQLKTGVPAEVTFPIPDGMNDNPPATIPLWSFDEEQGIWIEEGIATLQGDVYVGEVTHFSWVNLDDPKKAVTLKGKVVDCENNPVPYVKVTVSASIGKTSVYTGSSGQWTVVVPEYTPVVVSVTANGGSDSKNVPGYPGGTTQTVPDLKVPCGEGEGGEPGTHTETEKGAVKYAANGDCMAVTFDNNGMRFRMDGFDTEEDITSNMTYIINHYTKTFWYGTGEEWYDDIIPYNEGYSFGQIFTINEESFAPYQQGTVTIAGKTCKKFVINMYGATIIYASWNGLIMLLEADGEVALLAVSATLDVPEIAFTKTFEVTWL